MDLGSPRAGGREPRVAELRFGQARKFPKIVHNKLPHVGHLNVTVLS